MVKPIILPISYKSDPKGLRKAEQDLKGFASGIGKVIAGAVTAVAGIGVASVRAFANFDGAMTKSLAIMGDVSDSMRTNMSDAAREVAKATTFSAEEAAESYFFLASAGLDAEQQLAALPAVANFAQAGMFDMATATDLLTDAQSALGMGSDDAAENLENMIALSDMLVSANTEANATVEEFSQALTTKGAVAMDQFGLSTEEGIGVLSVFADNGVAGSRAGTLLSATLTNLSSNADTNAKAFEELGVAVFDSEGNTRDMVDIVGDLEGAMDGMSDQQRTATLRGLGFNRQALEGIGILLGNSEALGEYTDAIENSAGATDEVAKEQLQTFNAQLALLGSAINDVGIEIGTKLGPAMEKLVDQLGPVIEQVGDVLVEAFELLAPVIADVAKELPGLLTALLPVLPIMVDITRTVLELAVQLLPIFLGVVQALLPFVQRFANFMADNSDKVAGFAIALGGLILGIKAFNTILGISKLIKVTWAAATGVATAAQQRLNVAMRANPIGIVITLVAALVAALVWFFTQTETGRKVFETFVNFLRNAMAAAGKFFSDAWNSIVGLFQTSINGIVTFFRNLPRQILAVLSGAVGWLVSIGRNIIQGLRNGIDAIWRNVTAFFRGIPNAIRSLLGNAGSWLRGIGESVINGFLNGLRNAWRAVTSWISGAANAVSGAFRRILGIRSPSKVFMEHGIDIGRGLQIGLEKMQPKVMAEVGGMVSVGALSSSSLGIGQSLAPAAASGGMTGGDVYNINVSGGMMDPEGVAREVVRVLNNSQRRSGSGAGRLVA